MIYFSFDIINYLFLLSNEFNWSENIQELSLIFHFKKDDQLLERINKNININIKTSKSKGEKKKSNKQTNLSCWMNEWVLLS